MYTVTSRFARRRAVVLASFLAAWPLSGAIAQTAPASNVAVLDPVTVEGVTIQGPPPPAAPAVIARDAQDRVTLRAVHVPQGIKVDGQLDEEIYGAVPPMSDFVQMEPTPGAPATEKTDVWIAYDADNVYVTIRCWDSQPESRWIANEMRRDSSNIVRNENIAFLFDTFYDRRNAVLLEVTPIGAVWDGQLTNERPTGADWNPIWERKTGRFPGGWTVETAVPFKSLRYKPGPQVWGFNLRRTIRWKNEETYLVKLPVIQGQSGVSGIFQVSNAATLVGIEAPASGKNLEIKPYALSSLSTNKAARPVVSNDAKGVGSSRVDLQACKLEYSIVSPK